MPLTKIEAENFTVFKDITIPFGNGLNILVGENGVGKTHTMLHVSLLNMMCHFPRRQPCFFGRINPVLVD